MTGIHMVFIAVKRLNDGLMQMGLRRDSDDFSIASEVEKRLERLSIQSYIKCLDDKRLTERDRKELRGANIVVVVATRVSYLNAAGRCSRTVEWERMFLQRRGFIYVRKR